jgi:hypothetical protein
MPTMSQYSETKINKILQDLPRNVVATTKWLGLYGIGSDLLHRYKQSHWFTTIGHGAVIRTGDNPSWAGAVYALQEQLKLPVHIGGKSAIGYQGHAHYLPLGKEIVTLYCPYKTDIPKWFVNYDWKVNLKIKVINLFKSDTDETIKKREVQGFPLMVSSLERALFEILADVPGNQTLDESLKIIESLNTLNPGILQTLLETCNSIKVKRLFLLLAEKANHQWLQRLKIETIDLGSGNRVLYKGGTLNKKYKITILRDWADEEGYEQ